MCVGFFDPPQHVPAELSKPRDFGLGAAGFLTVLKRVTHARPAQRAGRGMPEHQKIRAVHALLILPCLGGENEREPKQMIPKINRKIKGTEFRRIRSPFFDLRHSAAPTRSFLRRPRSESMETNHVQ